MNDLELFRGMAKVVPLEPIHDADTYYRACELQEEYRNSDDQVTQLYFQCLNLLVEAYEAGYRPEED